MFGLLCLAPIVKKKEEDEEEPLLDPEYYRKYKWYGLSLTEKVARKMDYGKLFDKPYKLKNERESRQVREKRERKIEKEENPFSDLWT